MQCGEFKSGGKLLGVAPAITGVTGMPLGLDWGGRNRNDAPAVIAHWELLESFHRGMTLTMLSPGIEWYDDNSISNRAQCCRRKHACQEFCRHSLMCTFF